MGAWGNHPYENDTAADFVAQLKRAKKSSRIELIRAVFEDNNWICSEIKAGNTSVSLSESDIEEEKSSRIANLEWYRQNGEEFPFDTLPEYASEETWIAFISKPAHRDGSDEALRAIAGAQILIENSHSHPEVSRKVILPEMSVAQHHELCGIAIVSLEAILANEALAATWADQDWCELSSEIERIAAMLNPN